MLIDWFTVFAQIVNFLILIWLLNRFLYKPVLKAIDAREKHIADLLIETEQNQQQVQQQKEQLQTENASLVANREALLTRAKQEAETAKQNMLKEASDDVEAIRNKWLAALQQEQHALTTDIQNKTKCAVFSIARKVLQDLSNAELETHIVNIFKLQITGLNEHENQQFFGNPTVSLIIRSAQSLNDDSKAILLDTLKQQHPNISVSFEVTPELIGGIEMISGSNKLSWNINHYLNNLEDSMQNLVAKSSHNFTQDTTLTEKV